MTPCSTVCDAFASAVRLVCCGFVGLPPSVACAAQLCCMKDATIVFNYTTILFNSNTLFAKQSLKEWQCQMP